MRLPECVSVSRVAGLQISLCERAACPPTQLPLHFDAADGKWKWKKLLSRSIPLQLPPIHFYSETAEPPDVTGFDGGRVPRRPRDDAGTRGHVTPRR